MTAEPGWADKVTLVVDDGEPVTKDAAFNRVTFRVPPRRGADDGRHGDGERQGDRAKVVVKVTDTGRIRRATVYDGDVEVDLDAPAGTFAARTQGWARTNPLLYAAHHVVSGVGSVIWFVVGAAVVKWLLDRFSWRPDLPDIPWPHIDLPDLPSIPWPEIHLPSIDLPDLPALPAWVRWLLDTKDYWWPILLGVVLAVAEVRRQRRLRARREAAARTADGEGVAGGNA